MSNGQVNILFHKDGKQIGQYRYICFGRLGSSDYNKEIKACDSASLYFLDGLATKRSHALVDKYLDKLKEMGIYDKVKINLHHVSKETPWVGSGEKKEGTRFFSFTFNPSEVTPHEIFLFGSLSRMIDCKRRPIADWFRYIKAEPERDHFHLLLIALHCPFSPRSRINGEPKYHYLTYSRGVFLTGKNHKDYVREMSKNKPWGKTHLYRPTGGMSSYFINPSVQTGEHIMSYGEKVPVLKNREYQYELCGYSPELVESFFSEEAFLKFIGYKKG